MNRRKNPMDIVLRLLLCAMLVMGQIAPSLTVAAEGDAVVDVPAETVEVTAEDPAAFAADAPVEQVVDVPVDTPVPVTEAPATEAPTETPTEPPVTPAPTELILPEETASPEPMEAEESGAWTRTDPTPMDARDVMALIGISPDSFVDSFSVTFTEDGGPVDAPSLDAEIEMTIHLAIPQGMPKQLRSGDWYIIDLPETLIPADAHIIDLVLDGAEYARVEVETGPLRIKFDDTVQDFAMIFHEFTLSLRFTEDAYAPGETVVLSLPGEEAPSVSFTMGAGGGYVEVTPTQSVVEPDDGEDLSPEAEQLVEAGEIEGIAIEILDTPDEDAGIDPDATADPNATPDPDATADPAATDELTALIEALADDGTLSGEGLVTGFSAQYTQDGQLISTPTVASEVNVSLALTLSEALAAQIAAGSTYTIALPPELSVPSEQTVEVTTPLGTLGTGVVGTDGTITFTFADGAEAMAGQSGTLAFMAGFNPAAVIQAGSYTLTIPDEENAPSIPVMIYDTAGAGDLGRPDDDTPMDVKEIMKQLGISPQSILTGMNLTFQSPGQDPSNTDATIDSAIDFDLSLFLPSALTENMRQGDTYTITLPDDITVVKGGDYDLVGDGPDGSVVYGQAHVDENGTVTITFNDSIRNLGDATGSFHFSARFNPDGIDSPGDHVIKIPNEPDNMQQTVNIHSNVDQTLDKKGEPDKTYNPSEITWTVDFNKTAATLDGAVLADALPSGLTLKDVQVYTVDVDLNGNIQDGTEDSYSGGYDVAEDGTITFTGPIDSAIRVVYTTDITGDTSSGGNQSFTNNATLTVPDQNTLSTSSTVTARYGDFLDKRSVSYDPTTQEFTWQIRYNYGEQTINQTDATLTDILTGAGMVFEQDSVEVSQVTIDENGGASVGGAASGYTVNFNGNQMVISFDHDLSEALLITYKTKIDGIVDSSGVAYSNDVTTTWGGHDHESGVTTPTQQQNVIKTLNNIDDVNRKLTWVTNVNLSGYMMVNWSITDHFGPGLHLVDSDLIAVVDMTAGDTLTQGTDYTVESDTDGVFTITFEGDYKAGTDHTFQIVYYSQYDLDAPQTVTNDATVNWEDTYGGPHSSTSHVTYPRTPTDVDDGTKYGIYNAVTKEITWYVLANYHGSDVEPGELVDQIGGGQTYVPGSLKFYQYVKGMLPEQGTEIPASEAGLTYQEPSSANNQTLTITYQGGVDNSTATIWGVFKTSLDGGFVGESRTYDNFATLTINGISNQLVGRVTVNHGGDLVDKSGEQGRDGYVHWAATINGSQSTLEDVVVTDTPSANQRVDMNSLAIYGTSVDESGNVTIDTSRKLTPGRDYTATYEAGADGVWVLTVRFAGKISSPYILQYRASLYMDEIVGTASNNIRVDSSSTDGSHSVDKGTSTTVYVVEGGGVIYGKPGSVTIEKIGADGNPLPGAVLVLKNIYGSQIGPVTTDAQGKASFTNIVQGTYTLVELSAPEGYTVSPELAKGVTVTVNDSTTGGASIRVSNTLTEITLRKVDEFGQPLAGAVFQLEQYDESAGAYVPYGADTYTSGADGMVRVTGLPVGQYQFIEISAPEGYLRSDTPAPVTLEADANGVIAPGNAGDFVNHLVSLTIAKTSSDGSPLAGAVFRVTKDGNMIGTYSSGADGVITIPDLGPGTYLIVEISAPPGYTVVSDPRTITIPEVYNGAIRPIHLGTITNQRAAGSIILHKADGDTGTGLAGAVFDIIDRASGQVVEQVTTGEGGWAVANGLQVGEYSLVEVTAPAGYILNSTPLEFTVTEANYNSPFPQDIGTVENYQGRARIEKVDSDGQPLAGATFTLYDASDHVLGSYTTDSRGVVEIYLLAPGKYTLRETSAPVGFVLESDPRSFTIPDSAPGEMPDLRVGAVTNHRQSGLAIVHKVDALNDHVLADAVFELRNTSTGAIVTTVTTDDSGMASVSGLPSGSYAFVEVSAPDGYLVNETPLDFTITD
ncbi:Ig-like domain-containing protein, partial [Eubacteriales bacterium OttesenSCG-928-A19]|nr:Ig-like domain-containing protein [Eubacteriales bacterium OttesenSCG-928-A19]